MKTTMNLLFMAAFALVSLNANAANQAAVDYCQSMGEGLSPEDAQEMISQCIEEQSQYYDEDSARNESDAAGHEEEPSGVDCYGEAEAILENDQDADYDTLVQDCLNQHS